MANRRAPRVFEQRAAEPPPRRRARTRRLWQPQELAERDVSPGPSDVYLVIDARDSGTAGTEHVVAMITAVAAPWPGLDVSGRLIFSRGSSRTQTTRTLFLAEETFHAALDQARRGHDQAARDVRIGDAFWVRGLHPDGAGWDDIIDVSAAARESAKIALYGAVAAKVDEEEARWLDLSGDQRPVVPPPSGPAASPTV
jgi:hypothetical protein